MTQEAFEFGEGDVIRTTGEAFVVERALGHGGMAAVYLCQQPKMGNRHVVLKILHARYAFDGRVREAFEREPQAMARIRHKSIVEIYDRGFTDDEYRRPFFIMEHISGESLRAVVDRLRRLTPTVTTGVAMQILEGLHHLHKAGIVHCDVKPENIFVVLSHRGSGEAKLMDFGGIVFADEADPIARIGTPRYSAPEQLLGQRVTTKADLFSMGVTMYELLSGATPYAGGVHDWDACLRRVDEPIPSLREHAEVPPELAFAVDAMLARDPGRRPSALQALRTLQPIHRELERRAGDIHTRPTVRNLTDARTDDSQPLLRSADFQISTTPDPVNPALLFGDGAAEIGLAPTALPGRPAPKQAGPDDPTEAPSRPLPAADTRGLEVQRSSDEPPASAGQSGGPSGKRPEHRGDPGRIGQDPRGAVLRDLDGLPAPRKTPAPRLVVCVAGRDDYPIEHFPAVLGREPPSDIILDVKGVSGTHAAVDFVEGNYQLLDLGSTNGTHMDVPGGLVRLKQGEPYVLQDGDELWLGPLKLAVRLPTRAPRGRAGAPPVRWRGSARGRPLGRLAYGSIVVALLAASVFGAAWLASRASGRPAAVPAVQAGGGPK